MITVSNFNTSAASKIRHYMRIASSIERLLEKTGNKPLTCKEISEIVNSSYQLVASIVSHCNIFNVEKTLTGYSEVVIDSYYSKDCTWEKINEKTFIVERGPFTAILKADRMTEENGSYYFYKTVPIYATYVSLRTR